MEGDKVSRPAHFAAERVDLEDEVSLGGSADRGIAGHIGDCVKRHSEKHGIDTHSCRRKRCLDACMTGADYGVGVTGYAGPAQFEGDDSVGHVFVAVASARGTAVREHHLGAPTRGRNLVRAFAAGRALNLLRLELEKDE